MLSKSELQSLTLTSSLGGRLTRGFTMAGFLSKAELESLLAGAVRTTVIAGGAAGNHTVTGVEVGDALRAVLKLDVTAAGVALEGADLAATQANHAVAAKHTKTWSVADLTSEFSITAANTINNAGGTDTTGAVLVVVYEDLTP